MRLIVGLGNPGKEYAKSKHNIGFMAIDAYAKVNNLTFTKDIKFHGEVIKLPNAVLLKPKTFMNNSGIAVRAVAKFFEVPNNEILVISDDLDLPFGKLRLREKGSAGGHNGLKSIIEQIGDSNFNRLRVGIDRDDKDVVNYVLGKLTKEQKKAMDDLLIVTNNIMSDFINGIDFDTIMNTYNPNKK